MNKISEHNFHIPVLGVGFSVDTPLKVSKYGISSVISLVDDSLMEKFRRHYMEKLRENYIPVSEKDPDSRAKRITEYLNMINRMVKEQMASLRSSAFTAGSELHRYFEMLPDLSSLKEKYNEMLAANDETLVQRLQKWLKENIAHGSIDVNIMTKLDKPNYDEHNDALPQEYNDAHAALRGFALSDVEGSVVFSAGMNPRLFSYLETFKDFYPSEGGYLKKKIIIKVSDFRSAMIQGKFLAKKGLWVSEFRIESGLNCGGHAFASDGLLLGPVLEDFKEKKQELLDSMLEIYLQALEQKNIKAGQVKFNFNVTVQGGVGAATEHKFLLRHYRVSSVGWGSPFLLVPEVMNVDEETLQKLSAAGEEDLYLSGISPLGVPFNSMKGNNKDIEKMEKSSIGKPGAACTKKFLQSNREFSDKPLCTASISYLNKKIKELKEKFADTEEYNREYEKITEKACLCEGLSASAYMVKEIENGKISSAVSVCPGPNMAYFSKITGLKEMVDHIYGRINLITHPSRPNMFIKELSLNVEYFFRKAEESMKAHSAQRDALLKTFRSNLLEGIEYYKKLIPEIKEETEKVKQKMREDLERFEERLLSFTICAG